MEFERYLNRRMLTDKGWVYFCRICGEYKPEDEFYKKTDGVFGKDYKCKQHYTRKDPEDDGEMDYLKLNPLKETDFEGAQIVLERLGYKFGSEYPSVHEQFLTKHNLKKDGSSKIKQKKG
jgi:hypothetical protein